MISTTTTGTSRGQWTDLTASGDSTQLHVQGTEEGQWDDYTVTASGDSLHQQGTREGQWDDLTVTSSGDGGHLQGTDRGAWSDLTFSASGATAHVQGTQRGQWDDFTVTNSTGNLHVQGTEQGKWSDFTATQAGLSTHVQGTRMGQWNDFTVTRQGDSSHVQGTEGGQWSDFTLNGDASSAPGAALMQKLTGPDVDPVTGWLVLALSHTIRYTLLVVGMMLGTAWGRTWHDPQAVPFVAGLADAANDVAYVPDPNVGIDCLQLRDGTQLWQSSAPPHFLTLSDHRLFIWISPVNAVPRTLLGVAAVDARNGLSLSYNAPMIDLPKWVRPGAYGDGASWDCDALVHGPTLQVRWQAQTWYNGGVAPSKEILAANAHQGSGEITLDLQTGRLLGQSGRAAVPAAEPIPINGRQFTIREGTPRLLECRQRGELLWSHPILPRPIIIPRP